MLTNSLVMLKGTAGGIVKAAGLGDGYAISEQSHRQATLDDATHHGQPLRSDMHKRRHDTRFQ
jgi:hypothetical protein